MFKLIRMDQAGGERKPGLRIDIDIAVGGKAMPCPCTETCFDERSFAAEIKALQDALDGLLKEGTRFLSGAAKSGAAGLNPQDPPEKIWAALSKMPGEEDFILAFNSLDDAKRAETSEYILTQCGMFSGKGAVFSKRFNHASGLLE
ncbi:hypothetical protein [Desulfatiglans anilini]|uniref:hypothetical protein n=1 Tax=Desulfatiglans anilini TaxID=90728 RepID=UPI000400A75C|nr:hypothetical protein [Desulfatiglans anilini]